MALELVKKSWFDLAGAPAQIRRPYLEEFPLSRIHTERSEHRHENSTTYMHPPSMPVLRMLELMMKEYSCKGPKDVDGLNNCLSETSHVCFLPTLGGSVFFAFSKILRRLLSNLEQSHLHTLMLVAVYQHV